ncbi:NAD(P)H-dependent oxidoreductase [Mesorhizobium sp. VK22B]|uniref:NAD(P)H-dependent oxidoreductase n=1 Tax=Mesorhizobium captivum TaxID=3072319 RepID=A0ABU4ZB30_9HYPH|nr:MULTISPECIES: NAD(P)H-dependent oxidoreductase [unclassified Mesorhizobium]MDX8496411.1 NAD(P)H-dependent oxidoreductase [Mesorhizobium sp. VK22B]MDX8509921.1 NAD(P)H-dependent oxidoreductase [Mesorhizobium sp. VK22E]
MRIFSLIAHPRPNSFCHAISDRARNALSSAGHEIVHHDLYAERFQPCLIAEEAYSVGDTLEQALSRAADPIVRIHREEIASAEGLLIVHPNWWGKPPAILSGWLDRVLVPGVAYRLTSADGLPEALLSIAKAVIFNTSDTLPEREQADLGDPLELIWGRCVLPYCGVKAYERLVFRPVVGSSHEQRITWLSDVDELSRNAF